MAKVRVRLHGQDGFAPVDTEATKGATLGENLYRRDGSVVTEADLSPAAAAPSSLAVTLWRLVREIPANIKGLAAVTTNGWFRKDGANIVARELLGSDLPDLADSGAGSLLAIARDAKGRASGTRAVVAADIPNYQHIQSSPSATWTINHNLGRNVSVSVFTLGGVGILAEVVNTSVNQVQILLDTPSDGYAVLN